MLHRLITKYSKISKCNEWLYELLAKSRYVVTSLPLTTEVMNKAAEFWAEARQNHIPTTDNQNIDADMIISAESSILCQETPGRGIYVATTNLKHLKIFVGEYAQNWRDIKF